MAAASWGQVDLNNLNTLRNNIPAGVNNTLNRPNNMPDTASSADTSNGPKGIIYHVDIPDRVLQASVFMFNKLARNIKIIEEIAERTIIIEQKVEELINARKLANKIDCEYEKAVAYHDTVEPKFDEIRYQIDKLELIVDDSCWPLPKYRELLFIR